MKWISNNDPPLYVWPGDWWYNQKDKITYNANIISKSWIFENGVDLIYINFTKKTRIMKDKDKE